jgi:hypothetical protein
MNELIKKLKDKNYVRAFGLMKPEERECYQKVGSENCIMFSSLGWSTFKTEFVWINTYAIRPGYQPEPEATMNELIEKLKDKNYVRAFGLMKPEEQKILDNAGFVNRLVFKSAVWADDFDRIDKERHEYTFALKPGYQPEPVYIDIPIMNY